MVTAVSTVLYVRVVCCVRRVVNVVSFEYFYGTLQSGRTRFHPHKKGNGSNGEQIAYVHSFL